MARWVGLHEIAERYGRSTHTLYKWVEQGLIPHGRAGRALVFDVEACDEWVRQRGSGGRLDFPAGEERIRGQQVGALVDSILAKG